jgi:hemerythrin-like domain-containing protein
MTQKDWILLIVPILCNGVVVFILQKIYEKRQLAIAAKQKYVSILQEKIDVALSLFIKVIQSSGKDMEQINYLNQFIQSFSDIHYYYQQNTVIFSAIENDMNKALEVYSRMQSICQSMNSDKNNIATSIQLEDNLRALYRILQKMQTKCINYKI